MIMILNHKLNFILFYLKTLLYNYFYYINYTAILYVIYLPAVSLGLTILTTCPFLNPKYLATGSVTNILGN